MTPKVVTANFLLTLGLGERREIVFVYYMDIFRFINTYLLGEPICLHDGASISVRSHFFSIYVDVLRNSLNACASSL